MNFKVALLVLMAASGVGAYYHFTGKRPALQRVMEAPGEVEQAGYGGILELGIGPDVTACRERGRITVFVFTSCKSAACRKLEGLIGQFVYRRPDVAFRFIDVTEVMDDPGDWRGYLGVDVGTLPHVMIYDGAGDLIAGDERNDRDGLRLMYEWIGREHERYGSVYARE